MGSPRLGPAALGRGQHEAQHRPRPRPRRDAPGERQLRALESSKIEEETVTNTTSMVEARAGRASEGHALSHRKGSLASALSEVRATLERRGISCEIREVLGATMKCHGIGPRLTVKSDGRRAPFMGAFFLAEAKP